MKNLFKTLAILLITISCKAQSPIIDSYYRDGTTTQGAYYKDMNNLLDQYIGTYLYTNGSTSLKLILQKKIMAYDGYEYEDLLVGEYRYVENGVEKINTLNELNQPYIIERNHTISASDILKAGDYLCLGCTGNEVRIYGGIVDHDSQNSGRVIISKITVGNQQAIKFYFYWEIKSKQENEVVSYTKVPGREWVLIKQ